MKKLNITYEEFEKHMDDIVRIMKFQEDLIGLTCTYNKNSRDECELMLPMLVDNVVDLLSKAMHDDDDWISYWLFDLDCGRAYEDGMILAADGSTIKLATINDLWNILVAD